MKKIIFDLKWAQTLDGQLSDDTHTSQWISSSEERVETHRLRRNYDAVLVGASTFIKDLCRLTVRDFPIPESEVQPLRIVLDPRGRIATNIKGKNPSMNPLLTELKENSLRETIILSPEDPIIKEISNQSNRIVHSEFSGNFNNSNFSKDIRNAIQIASKKVRKPINSILVEGGPQILSAFITQEDYRRSYVSISSKLTGGVKNRIFLHRTLAQALNQNIENIKLVGSDLMIHLEPKRNP